MSVNRAGLRQDDAARQDAQHVHVVGYLCPSHPDGPMKPTPFEDPCGHDKAVWSDGTMTDA